MMQAQLSVYLGQEKESGFTGFISEDDVFGIVEIPDGISKEEGRAFLQTLKKSLHDLDYINLNSFEEVVVVTLKEHNIPSNISLVLSFQNNNIVYLKTVGTGKIYIRRNQQFAQLLGENLSASGYVQEGDLLIYTTDHFNSLLPEKELQKYTKHAIPHEIVDEITPIIKSAQDEGAIALFLSFTSAPVTQETQEEAIVSSEVETNPESMPLQEEVFVPAAPSASKKKFSLPKFKLPTIERKAITYAAVALISIILIWSVILGYQRRVAGVEAKKIESAKELITQKLDQAEEVSFLNMPRAVALINESKSDLNNLEKEGINKDKLVPLQQLIDDKEKTIVKKEDKSYSEFFDLSIDSKNAQGEKMSLDGDMVSIIDKKNGAIYFLNISKKSLTSIENSDIKSSSIIGSYEDKAYIYVPNKGIYEAIDSKIHKVISNETDWKSIKDIKVYNGNLYLLDRANLYKYVATDDGFSTKASYFQGSIPDLTSANSLAIDSSIYIGISHTVMKYTSGLVDDFNPEFPAKVTINKIVTTSDLDKVYAWDKQSGALYIINKSGEYERSISSSILHKANDIVIFENNIYILGGNKIYTIPIE